MMKDTIVPINVTNGSNTIVHIFFCYLHSNKRTCMCFLFFLNVCNMITCPHSIPEQEKRSVHFSFKSKFSPSCVRLLRSLLKTIVTLGFFFLFHFKTAAFSSWKQMVWEIEFILSFFQRTFQFPLMRVKLTLNSGV